MSIISSIFLRYKATKCGHNTKRRGPVSAFGITINTKMPKNENGSIDYCLDCIAKMSIRCAWCREPIFIGDPVTLYTPRQDFQIPEHAVVHSNDPLQLVGCLGSNCAHTGADRAGFWLPGEDDKGCVYLVQTPYEAILNAQEPSMVIIKNLADKKEALNLRTITLEDKR